MSLLPKFRPKGNAPPDKAKASATVQTAVPVDRILAIPVAARKVDAPGKTLIFYAYLFADTPHNAVERVRRDLQDDGMELLTLTGPIMATTLSEWTTFVGKRFDWFKESLPTAKQLGTENRGIIYYSPKIVQS